MKTQLLVSLFILSYSQMVFSFCDIFDIDCFFDNFVGKDSSEENTNETNTNLTEVLTSLSKSIGEMEKKLVEIPEVIKSEIQKLEQQRTKLGNGTSTDDIINEIQQKLEEIPKITSGVSDLNMVVTGLAKSVEEFVKQKEALDQTAGETTPAGQPADPNAANPSG